MEDVKFQQFNSQPSSASNEINSNISSDFSNVTSLLLDSLRYNLKNRTHIYIIYTYILKTFLKDCYIKYKNIT